MCPDSIGILSTKEVPRFYRCSGHYLFARQSIPRIALLVLKNNMPCI
jgi:hypothetical protein